MIHPNVVLRTRRLSALIPSRSRFDLLAALALVQQAGTARPESALPDPSSPCDEPGRRRHCPASHLSASDARIYDLSSGSRIANRSMIRRVLYLTHTLIHVNEHPLGYQDRTRLASFLDPHGHPLRLGSLLRQKLPKSPGYNKSAPPLQELGSIPLLRHKSDQIRTPIPQFRPRIQPFDNVHAVLQLASLPLLLVQRRPILMAQVNGRSQRRHPDVSRQLPPSLSVLPFVPRKRRQVCCRRVSHHNKWLECDVHKSRILDRASNPVGHEMAAPTESKDELFRRRQRLDIDSNISQRIATVA